jgi:hypothetical protein
MLGLIVIAGIMLSTAGLLSAPRMRRSRPCRADDNSTSSRADLIYQKDTLYTVTREGVHHGQEKLNGKEMTMQ